MAFGFPGGARRQAVFAELAAATPGETTWDAEAIAALGSVTWRALIFEARRRGLDIIDAGGGNWQLVEP